MDSHGQSLAYVYSHAEARAAQIANGLTTDEARRIASNIAKLPELLGAVRPDDDAEENLSDKRHEAEEKLVYEISVPNRDVMREMKKP